MFKGSHSPTVIPTARPTRRNCQAGPVRTRHPTGVGRRTRKQSASESSSSNPTLGQISNLSSRQLPRNNVRRSKPPPYDSCLVPSITLLIRAVYVKARHVGYQRGKRNTNPNVSLLTLDGVSNTEEAKWYLGKRAAFVYRAPKAVRGTKVRVIWGKIRSTHGMFEVIRRGTCYGADCTQATLALYVLRSRTTCLRGRLAPR
jgi:ribosomal protein L35AE/L33A